MPVYRSERSRQCKEGAPAHLCPFHQTLGALCVLCAFAFPNLCAFAWPPPPAPPPLGEGCGGEE